MVVPTRSGWTSITLPLLLGNVNLGVVPTLGQVSDLPATYTYEQLAAAIEQALGVRPALSTLRAAQAEARTAVGTRRRSLTAGMPAPLPSTGGPALFDAATVDRWLADHPRRALQKATEQATDALRAGTSEAQVVARARENGLSWRQITAVLNTVGPRRRSVAAVHRRYQHTGSG